MANLTFFTVTGVFTAVASDSIYDSGADPDLVPITGSVRFTPMIGQADSLQADTLSPPTNLKLAPITARIKKGTVTASGVAGVRLPANTSVLNIDGDLFYRVEFLDLVARGERLEIESFILEAPTSDVTVDLVDVARVAGSTVQGIIRGPRGYQVDNVLYNATTQNVEFYVQGAVIGTLALSVLLTAISGGAPGALDTLKELADALGDDANFATTVTNALAGKLNVAQAAAFRPKDAWVAGATFAAGSVAVSPFGEPLVRKAAGVSRSTYDATEQGLWASRPYQCDYWCDVANDVFRSAGEKISSATLLTHNTPGTPGYVEVAPAVTNLFTPFVGGGVGWVSVDPTFFPHDWTSAGSSVDKYVRHLTPYSWEFTMTVPANKNGVNNAYGLRSPLYSGVGSGGEVEVSFYLDMVGTNADKLRFMVSWDTAPGKAAVYVSSSLGGLPDGGDRGRFVVTLPPASVADDKILFAVDNPSAMDVTVDIQLMDIMIAPAVSQNLRDANPIVTGSQTSRSATLNVPNGNYTLFAWTDRGIVSANATASGGGGINLRTALGSAKIHKLAAWVDGRYVTGMVDDDPHWVPIHAGDTGALSRLHTKTANIASMSYNAPDEDWSLQRSATFWSRSRVEVRTGDAVYPDPSRFKRRNEVVCNTSHPFDTDIWMSYPFKIDGHLHSTVGADPTVQASGGGSVLWQWRYTDDVGDLVGLSPEFALIMLPNCGLGVWTQYSTVQNPDPVPEYTNRWLGKYVPGQWHHFVARMRFSASGGGKLGMWFDGQEIYAFQDTPIGHHKTTGPRPHWGYYGVQSDDVITIERGAVEIEISPGDLSGRILNPLPI